MKETSGWKEKNCCKAVIILGGGVCLAFVLSLFLKTKQNNLVHANKVFSFVLITHSVGWRGAARQVITAGKYFVP